VIQAGKKFTIYKDELQWVLIYHPNGRRFPKDKEGRKSKFPTGKRTYYRTLSDLITAMFDISLDGFENLDDLIKKVDESRREVVRLAQQVERAIYNRD